jgi:hypothetical protein
LLHASEVAMRDRSDVFCATCAVIVKHLPQPLSSELVH